MVILQDRPCNFRNEKLNKKFYIFKSGRSKGKIKPKTDVNKYTEYGKNAVTV